MLKNIIKILNNHKVKYIISMYCIKVYSYSNNQLYDTLYIHNNKLRIQYCDYNNISKHNLYEYLGY